MTINSTWLNSTAPTASSERPGISRRAPMLDLMRKGKPPTLSCPSALRDGSSSPQQPVP